MPKKKTLTKKELGRLQESLTQAREDKVRAEKDVEVAKKEAKEAKEILEELGVTPGTAQKRIDELKEAIDRKVQEIRDTIKAVQEEVL